MADYEAENLARLQKMFSRKWEFIFMQVAAAAMYSNGKQNTLAVLSYLTLSVSTEFLM